MAKDAKVKKDPVGKYAVEKKSKGLLYSLLLKPQKDSKVRVLTYTKHSEEIKGGTQIPSASQEKPKIEAVISRQDLWRSLLSNGGHIW